MTRPAPRCTLKALTAALLGGVIVSCVLWAPAAKAQAQRGMRFTDADGVVHTYAEPAGKLAGTSAANSAASTDNRSIVYRYTDADGQVHFYAQQVANRDSLMASSAATLNHLGGKQGAATEADPPFVRTMMAHPNAGKYDQLLNQAAGEFGVEAALLKAVLTAESGFNAGAVSTKGAIGLMQVMPATAERYGLQADKRKTLHQKLTDPKINIRLAARYLRDLMAMFPQHAELAIASYNAGEGAVQKYGNKIPPYPETQGYVRLVSRFYQLYRPDGAAQVQARADMARTARLQVTLPPHLPDQRGASPAPQAIAGTATSLNPLNEQHD